MKFNPKFAPGQSSITFRQGLSSTTYIRDVPTRQVVKQDIVEETKEEIKMVSKVKTSKQITNE